MSKLRQKARKLEPKNKLKTMNEISAAEAVKLFHACMHFDDPGDMYAPIPEGFPGDIAARDFLECLKSYQEMWAFGQVDDYLDFEDQMVEQTQVAADVSEQDLEELTPREKEVFLLRKNERLSYKEIAERLGKSADTVKSQLTSAYRTLHAPHHPGA